MPRDGYMVVLVDPITQDIELEYAFFPNHEDAYYYCINELEDDSTDDWFNTFIHLVHNGTYPK